MSFFEPRLKPLPDAFYSEGDASPVRSKVLRRSPTWPGYAPYKLSEQLDGDREVHPICEDPIIPLWPSTDDELTDDELETDVGQEKTESETWKADPKISTETQIQARKDEPVKQEAPSKVQVNLEAALSPSTSWPNGHSLTMLPLEHRGPRSDHPLDEGLPSFRPEKVPNFSCVSQGVLNGYVCPQYTTQPRMQHSEIKAASYEAFKKAAPKSRSGHEKHGTPTGTPGSSKHVGLQQPAGTTAPKSVEPPDNEQTAKARRVGDAARQKAREIGQERVKEKAMERPMMPAVDHLKPRHAPAARAPAAAAYGRANGAHGSSRRQWTGSCKA